MTTATITIDRTNTICAHCGYKHDAHGGMNADTLEVVNAKPGTGDFSFCVNCGRFCVYDFSVAGNLRKPNSEENIVIANDKACRFLEMKWRVMNSIRAVN